MNADTKRHHWSGRVLLWDDHGLFVGNAGTAELHESPAIKICVSLDGVFGLSNNGGTFSQYRTAVVPAGHPHGIDGDGCRMAMILLAPEGELGRTVASLLGFNEIVRLNDLADQLATILQLTDADDDGDLIDRTLQQAVGSIAALSSLDHQAEMDPRVAQSIEWIRAGRESGILVKDIAAEVDLSESRFSHLFSEHLRVPVRRYLLWLRLRDALHMLASVENLTEAAHSAGFSDSAHLTRTFRSALGIAPSDLVKNSRFSSFLS